MFKRWTVFDLEADGVVAWWFGDHAPAEWASKDYADSTRYEITSEYVGACATIHDACRY